ncbi:MAG: endonuclease MutS2 [Ruminococcus sp.]|nr:endonuclease MutS2 [Ruminococcus sp.]
MDRHYKALELDKILNKIADKTSCEESRELALNTTPEFNLERAKKNLQMTDDAYVLTGKFGAPSFGHLRNVANELRRGDAGGLLTPRELLRISETLRIIRGVKQWHSNCEGQKTSLDILFQGLVANKFLEDKIKNAIISDEEIADSASTALADIRRKIRTATSKAREVLDKIIHSSTYQKYLQDTIVTQRDGRYVVPVKAECRGNIPGLVHDTSASGQTLFIEPMGVVQANNDIRVLISKEDAEIERILFELSALAGSYADQIIGSYQNLAELDLIFAKADVAYDMKATVPLLNDKGEIDLRQARHPLINRDKVVPVDVSLGKEFDTLVITGPNTGGKTVTLKTIGLLTLMAMCGMMIPAADNSELSVFRRVLVDIGDEQSIEQSLSTFSAHMTNIIGILKKANSASLALIDELGAGTDPVEGAALAIAILEKLREKGAKIASTTHYAELKEFALRTAGIENGSCEFDIKTLRPTYRLLIGVPGKSNAFAISQRLGMDINVVNRAKELVSSDSRQFEDVVQNLESRRQSLEKQLENARRLTQKANTEKQKAENELEKAKRQAQDEIDRAREEAERIVSRTKAQAYALMDEMDKAKKAKKDTAETRAKLRRSINEIEDSSNPVQSKEASDYKLPRPLKVGDNVLIYDIDKDAVVLELPDKDNMVLVQAGIIKTRVALDNLRLKKSEQKKTQTGYASRRRNMPSNVNIRPQTEIDVRGHTAIEAIMAVDGAIDNAILSNVETITIIHGKGTGVLRKEIQQHLRTSKYVKNFRLGTFGEGESGVTIVTLK